MDGHAGAVAAMVPPGSEHLVLHGIFEDAAGATLHLVGDHRCHDPASETRPAPAVDGERYALDHRFIMEPGEAKRPAPPIQ